MTSDLASQFAKKQTSVLDLGGPVYAMLELPTQWTQFTVEFATHIESPVRGLRVKIRGGVLQVAGQETTDLTLSTDTAPPTTSIDIRWTGGNRSLRVWNSWRAQDLLFAWAGNAGFRVDELESGGFELSCSDGIGEVSFG